MNGGRNVSNSYFAVCEEDYAQSANTLFHFMKKEEYLKNILINKAIVPRYCIENIGYLNICDDEIQYEEVAVLQKCFCDIPFHKLTENFMLRGEGNTYELLSEEDKLKASLYNTHPDFYGEYAIAFSKQWGESHNLQPIHYLNVESSHTNEFTRLFKKVLLEDDIDDDYVNDILNRLSFIKPLRGIMNRQFITKEKKEFTIKFWKNFHDEKEWRYVPDGKKLLELGVERVIANPNVLRLSNALGNNVLEEINQGLCAEKCKTIWLTYNYDDIRYIIVPDNQARISLINIIMDIPIDKFEKSHKIELEKQILISKILVLEEIRKDW